jgi:hypothetical protein
MRNLFWALGLIILLTASTSEKPAEFPEATITNGLIEARLYLPDPKHGYYRGARFDWSGVMPSLSYNNHTYFGEWFELYNPTLHDAIVGPVDAFDPIGYADATPGDTFLKVGIGTLAKPDEKTYHFATPYKILDPGRWRVKKNKDQIEFVHQHSWKGIRYVYTKVVRLTPGKPELVLEHTLKNTGTQVIETNVYNHNFFVIDRQPTGPDFTVTFPFAPAGEPNGAADAGELQGNQIVYKRVLERGETLMYAPLLGYGESATDNRATIENQKTGAGVRISCDLPIVRMVYWSASTTLCPEPFSRILVAPGEEMKWNNVYEFYTTKEN